MSLFHFLLPLTSLYFSVHLSSAKSNSLLSTRNYSRLYKRASPNELHNITRDCQCYASRKVAASDSLKSHFIIATRSLHDRAAQRNEIRARSAPRNLFSTYSLLINVILRLARARMHACTHVLVLLGDEV